jgi:hypothetical protein
MARARKRRGPGARDEEARLGPLWPARLIGDVCYCAALGGETDICTHESVLINRVGTGYPRGTRPS